jgi:hypothetical protein
MESEHIDQQFQEMNRPIDEIKLPSIEDYEARERRKNQILYGRDTPRNPINHNVSSELPNPDDLHGYSASRRTLNVVPEDQIVKGIDIFSVRPGYGNKENFQATGEFEGTKRLSNGCDYAVQRTDSKTDCYFASFSYAKNDVPQLHNFSNKFSRKSQITLVFMEDILNDIYNNLSDKCTYEAIENIGSISVVFFYRKLKISVGRISDVNQLEVSKLRGILNDIINVIYMSIFNLEPKSMIDTWKDPETLLEQMKKNITLDDPTSLLDGSAPVEEEKQKKTWAEWLGFGASKPYIAESFADTEYY